MIRIENTKWTLVKVQARLTAIGKLQGREVAWIRGDLAVRSSWWITRVIWSVIAKYFSCFRKFFYRINLDRSKNILNQIRAAAEGHYPDLIPLFNKAVIVFNSVAPGHRVVSIQVKDKLPEEKPYKDTSISAIESKEVESKEEECVDSLSLASLHEKRDLVFRAKEWLTSETARSDLEGLKAPPDDNDYEGCFKTASSAEFAALIKQAFDYLQAIYQKLAKNVSCPVPFYFHATHQKLDLSDQSLSNILKSGNIEQSKALVAVGAYLSTNDESRAYGPYTISLDKEAVEELKAEYFGSTKGFLDYRSALWIRVMENVPVTEKSVACLIADAPKMDTLKKMVDNSKLKGKVCLLERRVAHIVRYALDKMHIKRIHPVHWNHLSRQRLIDVYGYVEPLPDNAAHFPS